MHIENLDNFLNPWVYSSIGEISKKLWPQSVKNLQKLLIIKFWAASLDNSKTEKMLETETLKLEVSLFNLIERFLQS